jgi:predicted homoserine dehydrogenase-like protein
MLPVGMAKGAKLLYDVKRDQEITYDMVELNNNSVLLQLRRIQDQMG